MLRASLERRERWARLGLALRAAREARGLSQGQVARRLGVHRPTVSEWEAGRTRVDALQLADLCALYGAAPGDLLGAVDRGARAGAASGACSTKPPDSAPPSPGSEASRAPRP
jgi:transcriptional regulator with XRE-family HTH domain